MCIAISEIKKGEIFTLRFLPTNFEYSLSKKQLIELNENLTKIIKNL